MGLVGIEDVLITLRLAVPPRESFPGGGLAHVFQELQEQMEHSERILVNSRQHNIVEHFIAVKMNYTCINMDTLQKHNFE